MNRFIVAIFTVFLSLNIDFIAANKKQDQNISFKRKKLHKALLKDDNIDFSFENILSKNKKQDQGLYQIKLISQIIKKNKTSLFICLTTGYIIYNFGNYSLDNIKTNIDDGYFYLLLNFIGDLILITPIAFMFCKFLLPIIFDYKSMIKFRKFILD